MELIESESAVCLNSFTLPFQLSSDFRFLSSSSAADVSHQTWVMQGSSSIELQQKFVYVGKIDCCFEMCFFIHEKDLSNNSQFSVEQS